MLKRFSVVAFIIFSLCLAMSACSDDKKSTDTAERESVIIMTSKGVEFIDKQDLHKYDDLIFVQEVVVIKTPEGRKVIDKNELHKYNDVISVEKWRAGKGSGVYGMQKDEERAPNPATHYEQFFSKGNTTVYIGNDPRVSKYYKTRFTHPDEFIVDGNKVTYIGKQDNISQ